MVPAAMADAALNPLAEMGVTALMTVPSPS